MHPELVVMLTWHDVTVENAEEIFLSAKDAPARYWGIKREGISDEKAAELIRCMKSYGKETFLETLAIDEPACVDTAKLAASCGVDHLIGTIYYDSVQEICNQTGMTYSPFIGLGSDTHLRGTIPEIVQEAVKTEEKGVYGVALSGFRYLSGNPEELIPAIGNAVKKPFILAGSVNSYTKLDVLKQTSHLHAFTIGGAFFEKRFGETFAEQIQIVYDYMQK